MCECVRQARRLVLATPEKKKLFGEKKKVFSEKQKLFGAQTASVQGGWPGAAFLLLLAVSFLTRIPASSCVSLGAHLVCNRIQGLTEKQRAMCRASPASIAAVGDGLRMAYEECRAQMAGARWNCSGVGDGNIFGHVMPLATKEAAFTYAITSAGVALALSAACARGGLPGCGCHPGNRRRSPSSASERFQWGGCADTAYGLRVARRLLDARELEADARSAVNLHNNRVGRKMVKDLIRLECKCHGVSGSCALKTCWRALPNFKTVATALKEKYMRAKMVARHPSPVAGHALVVVRSSRSRTPLIGRQPRKSELVYLQRSPSYCEPDEANGVYGTRGRHCSNKSRGENSCEKLCCGRGYNTLRHSVTSQCNCTFVWCCKVVCDRCTNETELFICK